MLKKLMCCFAALFLFAGLCAKDDNKKTPKVTEEDIALVASKWTGIPVTRLTQSETDKISRMKFWANRNKDVTCERRLVIWL